MEMSIDELVETAQKYNCMIVTKDMWNTAIGMSHKLQKIEQIVNAWDDDENAMILAHKIRKVIEDGNVD